MLYEYLDERDTPYSYGFDIFTDELFRYYNELVNPLKGTISCGSQNKTD